MNRRLEFHPEALQEATDAAIAYARIRLDLGAAFLDELEHAGEMIIDGPERWPMTGAHHRRYLLHRFPYLVVYRVRDDRIVVMAVAHASRRPRYWIDRR